MNKISAVINFSDRQRKQTPLPKLFNLNKYLEHFSEQRETKLKCSESEESYQIPMSLNRACRVTKNKTN